jgi:hypothetical protein
LGERVRVIRGLVLFVREFITAIVGWIVVLILILGGIVLSLVAVYFVWWFVKGFYG